MQPLLWSLTSGVNHSALWKKPLQTHVPPGRACILNDNKSVELPRSSSPTCATSFNSNKEKNAFLGTRFPSSRILGDEILCTNTGGVINQAVDAPPAREGGATTTTGVRRKPFVFLQGEGRSRHVFQIHPPAFKIGLYQCQATPEQGFTQDWSGCCCKVAVPLELFRGSVAHRVRK